MSFTILPTTKETSLFEHEPFKNDAVIIITKSMTNF